MKKISKSSAFWILIVLIVIAIIMILVGFGNQNIIYGILTGLVTGFIIKVLDWVTK